MDFLRNLKDNVVQAKPWWRASAIATTVQNKLKPAKINDFRPLRVR